MAHFLNTIAQIKGSDSVGLIAGISKHLSWQLRKAFHLFPCELRISRSVGTRFAARFAGLVVAGCYCPPFRSLTAEEDREIIEAIERSRADIVWVGLGAPKQDRWMFEHRKRLSVPVLIGVGAAFDFHTGRVPRAPLWMSEYGFEWLFRLAMEPRRLWKRYLVYGSQFVVLVVLELLGIRKFS
jgi:N-acetylglucosaminyldiphosphoundecaprenol N-acetyl-beta-D-mannosaminyltransferase